MASMMRKRKRSALLVIDFINDVAHENGKIPSCAIYVRDHSVIQCTNKVISLARNHNTLIIFVRAGFSQNYCVHPKNSPMFKNAKVCSSGTEFHSELDHQKNDIVVVKHRVSPFFGTSLSTILTANKVELLLLSGVSTNNAIQAAARDGHDRDYEVVILKDACGTANKQDLENALYLMSRFSAIINSDQVGDLL